MVMEPIRPSVTSGSSPKKGSDSEMLSTSALPARPRPPPRVPWTSRRIPTTWPCTRSPCPRGISGVSAWRSWRSRDGSALDSALALFDDQGRPIATDEFGRLDAPYDPYLFAGLRQGTYYVGVSGTGNLPGEPGGYDLTTRSAGSVPQAQAGGHFTLHVVADPADSPTQLLSFAVDQADPRDPQPTGLTLGFSGTINVVGPASGINDAIEVVDQAGHTWPVAFANYNESEARISYLFRQPLPEGVYTVRLPAQGGLVDLAGLSPVAPGEPDGVLGTFTVGPSPARSDPTDLGALLPDAALAGVPISVALVPGASASYRVVLTFPSIYKFQGQYSGGARDHARRS